MKFYMWRKHGLSLNHIAETLFASETFVKKAAFRFNENKSNLQRESQRNETYQVAENVCLWNESLYVKIDFLSACYGCRLFFAAEMIRLART